MGSNIIVEFKDVPDVVENENSNEDDSDSIETINLRKRGRPQRSFKNGSISTKQRRVNKIVSKFSEQELIEALKKKSKEKKSDEIYKVQNADKALALYADIDLFVQKFQKLKKHSKNIFGVDMYPSKDDISDSKRRCYPDNLKVTELGAGVNLINKQQDRNGVFWIQIMKVTENMKNIY